MRRGKATGHRCSSSTPGFPCDPETKFKFTLQNKDRLYQKFDEALFRDPGDPMRLTYPADHRMAGKFEEQMTASNISATVNT